MGKKSRRARGGGRRGTPTSTNSKVVSLTRHLLDEDEKIKKKYADGTLTISTLRTLEPTLRTAVARALGLDEEGIAAAVKATLLMYLDESMDKKNEAAKRKAPPPPPASEPEDPQRAISVATAVAMEVAKALPPHEESARNAQFSRAVLALREVIVTDVNDSADLNEFIHATDASLRHARIWTPTRVVSAMADWPHLRQVWPRLRRRICKYCGKSRRLSQPRFLVCGGCGEGREVGRYCSEDCQRAHWPEHQKFCPFLHTAPAECRPLRKMKNTELRSNLKEAMKDLERETAGLTPEERVSVLQEGFHADRAVAEVYRREGKL